MILSNVEIQKALDDGRLIIDPRPEAKGYDTTAIDLHLSPALSYPHESAFNYDLRRGGIAATLARNSKNVEIPAAGHVLERGQFVLGITRERVGLPLVPEGTLAARIEGKSSLARCGLLVHFTAPTVHAGWDGPLVLESKPVS
jgi:dCTP deaminase